MAEQLSVAMRTTWDALARRNAMHFIASERTDWDRDEFLRSGRETVQRLLESVDHRSHGVALDLGCGIGRLSLALAAQFDRVHGVDVSPEMIRRGNELKADLQCTNVEFHCNNGLEIACLPAGSCDLALSYIVLQHLPDPRIVLGYIHELGRVVKPGGHVLFQVPVYRSTPLVGPWRMAQRLFRSVLGPIEQLGLTRPEKGLAFRGSRMSRDDLIATLARSGLKTLSWQRTASPYRLCEDVMVYAVKN